METIEDKGIRGWANKNDFIIEIPDKTMRECLGNEDGKHSYKISAEKNCLVIQEQGTHGQGKKTIIFYASGKIKIIEGEEYKYKNERNI